MVKQVTVFTRASNWLGLGRVFPSIKERGFEITLIATEGDILTRSSCVNRVISIPAGVGDQLWIDAVLSMPGSRLLVGDDVALDWLLIQSQTNQAIKDLVTVSLGDIDNLQIARGKLQLSRCAESIGIAVPKVVPLTSGIDAGFLLRKLGWPLVFKSGYGYSGNEVYVCRNLRESRRALGKLRACPHAFVQEHITGELLMAALTCCEGRVLSQFTVRKRACWPPEVGPSTVVEVVALSQIEEAVIALVAEMRLSGLISFDFIRDVHGDCWLLECNLRPVPVSHLGGTLIDTWLANETVDQVAGGARLFALFPQSSLYPVPPELLKIAVLDKPSNDPGLLAAMEQLVLEKN